VITEDRMGDLSVGLVLRDWSVRPGGTVREKKGTMREKKFQITQ